MNVGLGDTPPIGIGFALEGPDRLVLQLSGEWRIRDGLPTLDGVAAALADTRDVRRLGFDTSGLAGWDSALVSFLVGLRSLASARGITVDPTGLPPGARRLVDLALAVPAKKGTGRMSGARSFLAAVGEHTLAFLKGAEEMLAFLGEATLMFGRFLAGRATYRRSDLALILQECGAQALPIVTIISLLVGLILAFVGAVQLEQFGAEIYVADLVGIAMAREMGAIMTGIVMAGRTGAAFAAQIGTMQGNEEIDALTTFGIPPIDFLVLPRMLALMLMMPLLCIYADLMGIAGGWIVATGMLDVTSTAYFVQTQNGVSLTDLAIGIFKSALFGALVAVAGCLRGMQCGRNAAAVGNAATSAVVTGIVSIIVADGLLAVLTHLLGV
jgi:phospholipid/cholesterol/gamma-HCH transport system permease protein